MGLAQWMRCSEQKTLLKSVAMSGVTARTPSRSNISSTAHGAPSAAATELRRSRCCDGAAQTSSVALIMRVASATELMLLRRS